MNHIVFKICIFFSLEMLQKILENPLEKKAGRNYGPPGSKTLIYFIDDINMPEVSKNWRSPLRVQVHIVQAPERCIHLSDQPLPHQSIMVPPEKPTPFIRQREWWDGREKPGKYEGQRPTAVTFCRAFTTTRRHFYSRLFLFFFKSARPAIVLQKPPHFFSIFPYHSLFLIKEKTLNKKHLWKMKTLNLFFFRNLKTVLYWRW